MGITIITYCLILYTMPEQGMHGGTVLLGTIANLLVLFYVIIH
jgi:hypothetical protein